jgi:glycosyltransferase involved in cell wall biosynthesis
MCLLEFDHPSIQGYKLADSIEKITLGTGSLRNSLPAIVRAIKRLRPKVVFSTLGYVNIALLALKPFLPRETRIWIREANIPSISLPNNRFPSLMIWGYKMYYRRADLVICSSERMSKELANNFGVPIKKLRILPNPVDEKSIRKHAVNECLCEGKGVRFVAAGRLIEQKGFDRLLEIFAELRDPVAQLIIVGDGPKAGELARQARQLGIEGQVKFTGFVDNPWVYFAASDAFLLPSRWEGMPNAALEALALGVPVIATPESGGVAELSAASRPGAVTVAVVGRPFVQAMRQVVSNQLRGLRPSLLPSKYELESAISTFECWLDQDA